MERKIHFRENWLIFLGIWGEAELFLGILGAKENTFREQRKFFSGIWGDHCIIFWDQGSTDPPGGLNNLLGLIMAQTVCKGFQQRKPADKELFMQCTLTFDI